jgi:hypothetical protein
MMVITVLTSKTVSNRVAIMAPKLIFASFTWLRGKKSRSNRIGKPMTHFASEPSRNPI